MTAASIMGASFPCNGVIVPCYGRHGISLEDRHGCGGWRVTAASLQAEISAFPCIFPCSTGKSGRAITQCSERAPTVARANRRAEP